MRRLIATLAVASLGVGALFGLPAAASADPGTAPSSAPAAADDGIRGAADDAVPVEASALRKAAKLRATRAESLAVTPVPQVHYVYINVVSATADTGDDVNTVPSDETQARAVVAEMNTYWQQESGGAISLSFGGFENTHTAPSCDLSSIFTAAPTTAFAGIFNHNAWVGTFRHLVTFSREECTAGGSIGLGTVGADGGLVASLVGQGPYGFSTENHEFGHNLGFEHSSTAICPNATFDAPQSAYDANDSTCELDPYADLLDLMSASTENARTHLSVVQRIRMGWLADFATASTASTTATYTIKPLGGAGATGIRALKVVDPSGGDVYYVEYRTADAADSASYEFTQESDCSPSGIDSNYSLCAWGAATSAGSVRVLRYVEDDTDGLSTTVMAVGPVTPASAGSRQTHLDSGTSFTNYDNGFTIGVATLDPSAGATVTVTLGAATPATTTTLVVDPSGGTVAGGSNVTARVTLTGYAPVGTLSVRDGATTVATAPVSAAGTVSIPLGELSPGSHSLTAAFTPTGGTAAPSVSSAQSLTVLPITTTTTLNLTGSTLTARVAVARGTSVPTGVVAFTADGTQFGRVALASAAASVTVPSLAAGTHPIVATFVPADPSRMSASTARGTLTTHGTAATTISKASAKVTAKIASKVKTTKRATVKVTVTSKATARPTGTLVVVVNGKTITSKKLTSAMKGRVTITLPKIRKTGVKKLLVYYAGTSKIASRSSTIKRFKVVR